MGSFRDIKTSLPINYNPTAIEGVLRDITQQADGLHSVGSVLLHAGAVPPGWLAANGIAVGRKQYQALYAIIGTKYGSGDGNSTFNLPSPTPPANMVYIVKT
jgi:hypothetical protein